MSRTMAIAIVALLMAATAPRAQPQQAVAPTLGDRVAASERTRTIKRLSDRANAGVGTALGAAGDAVDRAGKSVGGLFGRLDAKVTGALGGVGLEPRPGGADAVSRPGWADHDK